MVILIAGTSHTGKTMLAQRLLEEYHFPYLSMDHLKMGLIRSGVTNLTVFDDDALTEYLWPIVREMVKTAIENGQNLIVEGCYIPFCWQADFDEAYLPHIRCRWLIMTPDYIRTHFADIRSYANAIEARLDDSGLNPESLIRDNRQNLEGCRKYGCDCILIEQGYDVEKLRVEFMKDRQIRTAVMADLPAITRVEAACFPAAEAATEAEFAERLHYYCDHFWLMFEGEELISFVDGFVTDIADLSDEMYADAAMHNPKGAWQMIFGVNTVPSRRGRGYAGQLIERAIADARVQGRKGLVLTCKDHMIRYYAKFGFRDEGISGSTHGSAAWHQMRLTFDGK